jgi:hypothetical protein
MASSFSIQIPAIIHLLQKLKPESVLDIGKGFGKYGFLIHEYVGINNSKKIDPGLSMSVQSSIKIDAVEVDEDLMLPHLDQIYSKVYFGDVFKIYKELPGYELILMVDVIEHLDKENSISLLKYFLSKNSTVLISTPLLFFEQHLYQSEFENHISHWTLNDFKSLGFVDYQFFDGGCIYLLSNKKIEIRGFGHSFIKKIRRIARAFRNEISFN